MAYEFKFPDVGEGITEGEIVKWLVKEGDKVKEHDNIMEVETDKAVVQLPSPVSGLVLKIHHKEGDTVKVGETLVTIGEKGESAAAPAEAPAQLLKKVVSKGEPKPLKTGKESKPEAKPAKAEKGASVVGELEEAKEEAGSLKERAEAAAGAPAAKTVEHVLAVPAVRRLSKELNVDLAQVKGTGKEGRVTEEDVRKFSEGKKPAPAEKPGAGKAKIIKKQYDLYGYLEKVPLKGIRKVTAKHMTKAIQLVPHVTHMDEADVTHLVEVRAREKEKLAKKKIKLTYLPYIMKACIVALKEFPYFNASLDDEHEEIILKKYYNIGIAVDTPNGLVVPVIKGADQKNLPKLAKEIEKYAKAAEARSLNLADMKGGTFTITNIGVLGGTFATPIVNWPDTSILATGRIKQRAVVKDGSIQARYILPISVSFDHRVTDGAAAARFTNRIIELLEDPDQLLLEEK